MPFGGRRDEERVAPGLSQRRDHAFSAEAIGVGLDDRTTARRRYEAGEALPVAGELRQIDADAPGRSSTRRLGFDLGNGGAGSLVVFSCAPAQALLVSLVLRRNRAGVTGLFCGLA